jgi:integrase
MAKLNSVRIKKTEYGSYSLNFTNLEGRRRRLSVGENFSHAQRLAVRFEDWLLDGKNPEWELERLKQNERAKSITLREFYPMFMERHGSHQSVNMQSMYHYRFLHIIRCPQVCDIPMENITKRVVYDFMNARIKHDGIAPATANREMSIIKSMLFRAVEWDILPRNPLAGLKTMKEAEKRDVRVTFEQAADLISELSEPTASIVSFAIYTGFRKENILDLSIEQVRFHDLTPTGEVELKVKGGRNEVFPLSPAAVEVIQKNIGQRKKGYVFINPETGTRFKTIHKGFNNAVRKLKLTVNDTKLRFHDLRHMHATWLHKAGVSLDIVRVLLGHRDVNTTDRYVSYDRLSYGNALSAIPTLSSTNEKRVQSSLKTEPERDKFGKNWQAVG